MGVGEEMGVGVGGVGIEFNLSKIAWLEAVSHFSRVFIRSE